MQGGEPHDEDTQTLDGAATQLPTPSVSLPARWRLQREVGRGGQAEVWLARDAELATFVAIKVFKAELTATQRERLRREVTLGRTLHHPGLVRVYELIDGGDRLAVAMEWVPEGSLAQRLDAGPLAINEVVRVAEQVLEVLAYLHEKNVVHRDIKPSNLLVDSEGRVRLADLGLARPLDDDRGLTNTLAAVGTPAYMSPEQIRGEAPAPATDLYGLGVTLYQLVTASLPFTGTSEFDVANKHLTEPAGDPREVRPECPAWLAGFISRLLEKSPRDRFASATCALDALGRRRVLVSPRTWRRAAALAAVLAVAATGAAFAVRFARRDVLAGVTVTGGTVTARDAEGRELWSREYPNATHAALVADVLGDTAPEVVIGVNDDAGKPSAVRDLLVLDSAGKQQAGIASAEGLLAPPFDGYSDLIAGPRPYAIDLDGDRRAELVWIGSHQLWYPAVIGAWGPRAGIRPAQLLVHSGRLEELRAADMDGDGASELVVTGVNNPLGWQTVVAVLKARPNANGTYATGASPDLLTAWIGAGPNGGGSVVSYSLLGSHGGGSALVDAGRSGITLDTGGRRVRLDVDGNPEGSPLFGKGGAARRRFWSGLALQCKELEAGRVGGGIDAFRDTPAEVLREPPMRLAASLLLARSLAIGGNHARAVELLRASLAEMPEDLDLRLRLGEQLAIVGERRAAMTELARATQVHTVGRMPLDAALTWAFVASMEADEAEIGKALAFCRAVGSEMPADVARGEDLQALWAFCRGDWGDAGLQRRETTTNMPFLAVLRKWAELERGADPATVVAGTQALADNAEVRELARTLEARALVGARRVGEAQAIIGAVVDTLTRRARTDVLALAWLALAHHVSGEAAVAAGDWASAADHFREAVRIAPRCWFGRPPQAA
jgi:thioredoxin-like negative regulator of GroEL